jgi:hypothetical protein
MRAVTPLSRKRAVQHCLLTAATALACAGLLWAAALVPAPAAVLPFVVVICIACPMLAAWELPRAVAGFRHYRAQVQDSARALSELRAGLAELPETSHPLGF